MVLGAKNFIEFSVLILFDDRVQRGEMVQFVEFLGLISLFHYRISTTMLHNLVLQMRMQP